MNDNETVAEIVGDMRAYDSGEIADVWMHRFADRIEAANRREILVERKLASDHITGLQDKLAVINGERNGILKANEQFAADNTRLRGEIAGKDAEIASLRALVKNLRAALAEAAGEDGGKDAAAQDGGSDER